MTTRWVTARCSAANTGMVTRARVTGLLQTFEERNVSNPVIIGGDVHATYVCDVKKDFDDPASPTLASEFVCTSITSTNWYHDRNAATLVDNPHIKLFEGRHRGYSLVSLNNNQMTTDLRVVNDVSSPNLEARTLKSYVVEDGRPGPQLVSG